jgi:hypothetical protein
MDDFDLFGTRLLMDVGARFWFPIDYSAGYLAFLNFGIGLGIDLVKYVLSPGIYLDVGIGIDWFYIFSDKEQKKEGYIPTQFFFSGGARLYNIMNISELYIIPHIGYNLLLFYLPFLNVGVSVSFGQLPFAIEYAYYPPRQSTWHEIHNSLHHIMLKISASGVPATIVRKVSN